MPHTEPRPRRRQRSPPGCRLTLFSSTPATTCSSWSTRESWTRSGTSQSYKGVAFQSVVVFALRNGNPKHIKGWNDLLKPGVEIITPNPFTAGIAKWNILAAYAAQRALGKTEQQAQTFVKKLFDHVVAQDSSGSNATNTFLSGKGDVLLTFESEAINARAAGRDIQYVIPRQTMLIDVYTAVTKKQREQGHSECLPSVPEVAAGAAGACAERLPPGRTRASSSSSRSSFPSGPARSRSPTR